MNPIVENIIGAHMFFSKIIPGMFDFFPLKEKFPIYKETLIAIEAEIKASENLIISRGLTNSLYYITKNLGIDIRRKKRRATLEQKENINFIQKRYLEYLKRKITKMEELDVKFLEALTIEHDETLSKESKNTR